MGRSGVGSTPGRASTRTQSLNQGVRHHAVNGAADMNAIEHGQKLSKSRIAGQDGLDLPAYALG